MRVLFLIPGSSASQLQAFPAVAAVAEQLNAQVQVVAPTASAPVWKLLPQLQRVLAFGGDEDDCFGGANSLADWANLLGSVRDPDFQACINLATGRQVNLMLSMTHIPTRIAQGGFGLTEPVRSTGGWPNQALDAYLRPLGVSLDAEAFRLSLPRKALEQAVAGLPAGDGPALLLAPSSEAGDWPAANWQALPEQVRLKLPGLRVLHTSREGGPVERAAQVAAADVVLGSDPMTIELALLSGTPVVALGRSNDTLPRRQGVQGIGSTGGLDRLDVPEALQALGLG
ncbi:glycosyltransferase family 9 protein [Cyanobium sp. Morenito 9A2]|uniref:glycosyltransferase family 9 protein n=1 Tax=Cyanobium sp. Morenito 9A2 TaxID=2823718 RepID=UPI0020CE7E2B|nr:lipopolysaccharide heptosyltransferase family protein [Cyanobium sp. Morenito 9A2]MCP9848287.1 lipopolysaccharide heptosyltransferase family protein [Cyanobium sp. Morenito 9A2]